MTEGLRYGLAYLCPSEIAGQFYCEYQVHLKRTHPEVDMQLKSLERGDVSHTSLVSQVPPITKAELEKTIQTGNRLAMCEWTLEGQFEGVRIRGRPDLFGFEGKKGLLLLDFKFGGGKQPFRHQEVQAETYVLLTESMGFSAEELCFGIVMFPGLRMKGSLSDMAQDKSARLQLFQTDGTLQRIYERCQQDRLELLKSGTKTLTVEADFWKVFLYRYDRLKAEKDLSWALGFWRSEREPIPVKRTPRKCFSCPFNAAALCQHALQAPDPKFEIQRRQDGRIIVARQ